MRASPRSYARFTELPPGAIQPEGWLRQYTQINADGWLLRYAQMRDPELYSVFWDRVASLEGYWDLSCDFAGYFADGLVRYAQLVPESDLAAELDEWLRPRAGFAKTRTATSAPSNLLPAIPRSSKPSRSGSSSKPCSSATNSRPTPRS